MNDFLYTYARNVYSANGEDGINKQLLNHLQIDGGVVLEIGAWDGFFDSNCADLWCNNKNFGAILVESTDRLQKEVLEQDYDNVACFNEFKTINNFFVFTAVNACFDAMRSISQLIDTDPGLTMQG